MTIACLSSVIFCGVEDRYIRDSYGRVSLDQPENNRYSLTTYTNRHNDQGPCQSSTPVECGTSLTVSRASTSTSPMNKRTPASGTAKPLQNSTLTHRHFLTSY
jgi:hypothetical protein